MEQSMAWSDFLGYLKYIWREKKLLYLCGLIFFPAFITANFMQVYLPKMIIMELEEKRSIVHLGIRVLGLILVMLLCIIVREKMHSQIDNGNRQVTYRMQKDYADKLLYVDYGYLEDKDFLSIRNMAKESLFGGEIGSEGRAQLKDFMETLVMELAAVGNIMLYLFYLGKLSWWLTVLLFFLCFFELFINMKVFNKNEAKYGQRSADSWQKLDYVTRKTEDFSMAKDVRLYSMNTWLSGLIKGYLGERLYYKKKELTASGLGAATFHLSMGIFWVSLLWVVLWQFWDQNIGVSDVVFYANMGPLLFNLVSNDVARGSTKLFRIVTEFHRFQEFIGYGTDTGSTEVPVRTEATEIILEHVSFSFPGAEKEVLKDIDLHIKAGEKLAIVGVNGAGKTTLMKLICGLLHPTGGRILLNGTDMEIMEAEERYAWFSCTFQDVQFLPVSIRENISQEIGRMTSGEEAGRSAKKKNLSMSVQESFETDRRIWHCLHQAGIRKEIEQLPDQLDTLLEKNINEDAIDFSGGQRQKIILARALCRDAGALILDEPTAALDALAENEIYEKYAEFTRGKTSFFVSHRLASTRFCDRILLLDGGSIAEMGTHEELLAKNGLYAEMFEMQSKYYDARVKSR